MVMVVVGFVHTTQTNKQTTSERKRRADEPTQSRYDRINNLIITNQNGFCFDFVFVSRVKREEAMGNVLEQETDWTAHR